MTDLEIIENIRTKGIKLIGLVSKIPISSNHYIIENKKVIKLVISKEKITQNIFKEICNLTDVTLNQNMNYF